MYALGAYRNLIAGATTVADHFRRMESSAFFAHYPIDVLHKYGRTWTPRHLTDWGDDIPTEYGGSVRAGQPYIIHLAEGLDVEASQELDVLIRFDAVGRNTVIIHGISLRPDDMQLLAGTGASVCWCPASNLYLYGQTADIPALCEAGVNVTLGTDSTMTGGLNLLDEARTARDAYRAQAERELSAQWLVEGMTTRAAYALMLDDRRGRIEVGYEADLLVLPDGGPDPYTTLIQAEPKDIALLIRQGVPIYGDTSYQSLFEQLTPSFTPVVVAGEPKLVTGDLLGLTDRISRNVGKAIEFPFLPCSALPPQSDSP
jgi:hypothetical protein